MLKERREYVRLKYPALLGFKVCDKNTITKLCSGYTVDISQSGLLCNIGEKVNPDDILWLSFNRATLDFCKELEEKVLIYQNGIIGKVVRVEAKGFDNFDVGIKFITRGERDWKNVYK